MSNKNKEMTTFVTPWETFSYNVMSFRLKNIGATYQRAVVTLFHNMMYIKIEVYVDDMIDKSKEGERRSLSEFDKVI
jgi:hypothetical protein